MTVVRDDGLRENPDEPTDFPGLPRLDLCQDPGPVPDRVVVFELGHAAYQACLAKPIPLTNHGVVAGLEPVANGAARIEHRPGADHTLSPDGQGSVDVSVGIVIVGLEMFAEDDALSDMASLPDANIVAEDRSVSDAASFADPNSIPDGDVASDADSGRYVRVSGALSGDSASRP